MFMFAARTTSKSLFTNLQCYFIFVKGSRTCTEHRTAAREDIKIQHLIIVNISAYLFLQFTTMKPWTATLLSQHCIAVAWASYATLQKFTAARTQLYWFIK